MALEGIHLADLRCAACRCPLLHVDFHEPSGERLLGFYGVPDPYLWPRVRDWFCWNCAPQDVYKAAIHFVIRQLSPISWDLARMCCPQCRSPDTVLCIRFERGVSAINAVTEAGCRTCSWVGRVRDLTAPMKVEEYPPLAAILWNTV